MRKNIIGRKEEIRELEELYHSGRSEFVVIYGRRRVGKTFLVRELFEDNFAFYHTGLSPLEAGKHGLRNQQLQSFYASLIRYGSTATMQPENWIEAFEMLISLLESKGKEKRLVVFIDEMPWMDTPRSMFVTALEHFWNGWASGQHHLMLIVCGSATSWLSDKLINNHGGLYNRTTYEIKLSPFTLCECEEFFRSRGIELSRYDQLQCYMIFGGIPYYLSLLQRGRSLAQNIDRLCFQRNGKLVLEFHRLFSSLFTNPDECIQIVRLLSKKRLGFRRKEIAATAQLPYGGGLTNTLQALAVSDFITSYIPYGASSREVYYRLQDSFSLFYLHFMEQQHTSETFWSENLRSPRLTAWRGFSFETVCFAHLRQIKQALGITGVHTEVSPWLGKSDEGKAQIDMLIDRADQVVNVCEMKYSGDTYEIDAAYDNQLRHKLSVFASETGCRKALHLTFVTTYGLCPNAYSYHVQNTVTMEDLFLSP